MSSKYQGAQQSLAFAPRASQHLVGSGLSSLSPNLQERPVFKAPKAQMQSGGHLPKSLSVCNCTSLSDWEQLRTQLLSLTHQNSPAKGHALPSSLGSSQGPSGPQRSGKVAADPILSQKRGSPQASPSQWELESPAECHLGDAEARVESLSGLCVPMRVPQERVWGRHLFLCVLWRYGHRMSSEGAGGSCPRALTRSPRPGHVVVVLRARSWQSPSAPETRQVTCRRALRPGAPAAAPRSLTPHTSGGDESAASPPLPAHSDPGHFVLALKPVGRWGRGRLSSLPLLPQSPRYLQAWAVMVLERTATLSYLAREVRSESYLC